MTDTSDETRQKPHGGRSNGRNKGVILTLVAIVALLGVVAGANRDRLSVHSDVGAPTPDETHVQSVTTNRPPQILNLSAATDRIQPFDLCDLVCDAIDPDDDVLTYEWSVSSGSIFGDGPEVEWGAPISEGLYRVSVVVRDGRGGTDEESISLRVKANAAPQIMSMSSDTDWLSGGDSARFWCEAMDPDGDDFSYHWSATGGEIFGEGDAIMWLAPDETDSYWITVTVTDAYGGEARRALPISVTPVEPPSIEEMVVAPLNTKMFKSHGDSWTIYQGKSCSIECVVGDGDGPFTYEWSADHGTITADGSVASWESPKSTVGATIVVVVTDVNGHRSTASALIYVETCPCSF